MDIERIVRQMESQAQAVRALAQACTDEQARWRPDPASWSVLEVVNHLLDEEREDFRARLELVLRQGNERWASNDPMSWVTARRYNERDLAMSLAAFLSERQTSLAWLRDLPETDWGVSYEAPFGQIRAGDILVAWIAHDLLHTRQLVELRWAYLVQEVESYSVRYAGEW
jgi:hypothetical protein